jgi:hypothetical protein
MNAVVPLHGTAQQLHSPLPKPHALINNIQPFHLFNFKIYPVDGHRTHCFTAHTAMTVFRAKGFACHFVFDRATLDDKLMLHISNCYLSLALSGELPQRPDSAD